MSRVEEFVGCRVIEFADHDDNRNHLYSQWLTKESIVRCRDCSWFHEDATLEDQEYPHFCHQHGIDLMDGNGFCAWGER